MAQSIALIGFNVGMLMNNDAVITSHDDAQRQTIGGGSVGHEEYSAFLFEKIANCLPCFARKWIVPVAGHVSLVRFLHCCKDFRENTSVVVTGEMTQAFIHKPLTLSQPPPNAANSFFDTYYLPFLQVWHASGASFYLSYGRDWCSAAATCLSDIVRYTRGSRLLRVG